jgi:chemotaxis receptor (MCP) glutamine deamidase CheD
MTIGERNIQLAEDTLRTENIPVLSAVTCGKVGRKLIFNNETGVVLVKRFSRQIDDIRF